jgi:epoxyqueuosine reductase
LELGISIDCRRFTLEPAEIVTPLRQTSGMQVDGWSPKLRRWLEDASREAGFDAVGVAEVRGPDDPAAVQHATRFEAWVDAGHAGEMEYLKRRNEAGTLLRSSLCVAMPWARSAIVCAMNYNSVESPLSIDPAPPGAGWIARYAWTGRTLADGTTAPTDYHGELLARLRSIEEGLLTRAACTTRCYVDTGPLVERALAAEAGIGWIGKNTCLLNQQLGSWLLLCVLVTSLPVEQDDKATSAASASTESRVSHSEKPSYTQSKELSHGTMPAFHAQDRCGTCTRCIDACPTGALLGSKPPNAPRTMDASRCIAYLTIEKKGAIDPSLRAPMGRHVFGCDICQDVCPWNGKPQRGTPVQPETSASEGMPPPRPELINPALDWLAAMDASQFKRLFKGSPLERTGRKRLLRNVAIAMGNSGEAHFLPQLDEWATGDDAVLADAAQLARARLLA